MKYFFIKINQIFYKWYLKVRRRSRVVTFGKWSWSTILASSWCCVDCAKCATGAKKKNATNTGPMIPPITKKYVSFYRTFLCKILTKVFQYFCKVCSKGRNQYKNYQNKINVVFAKKKNNRTFFSKQWEAGRTTTKYDERCGGTAIDSQAWNHCRKVAQEKWFTAA